MINSTSGLAAEQLRQIIEKIERLEEDKVAPLIDIKSVYDEAKSSGFDNKIIRQIIKLRKMDKAELEEQEEMLELYKKALGMVTTSYEDED